MYGLPAKMRQGSLGGCAWANAVRDRACANCQVLYGGTLTSTNTDWVSFGETEIMTDYFPGGLDESPGGMWAHLQANFRAGTSGTIYARLWNMSDGEAVAGSEIYHLNVAGEWQRVESDPCHVDWNKRYCVQMKHVTAAGQAAMLRLVYKAQDGT